MCAVLVTNKLFNLLFKPNYRKIICSKSTKAIFEPKNELINAVNEAEKIVGYPTSFLNLRWLLTDELANVAFHLRKLIGTNHPLIETARKVFIGNATPAWGLIVLLVSKAYGLNSEFAKTEKDIVAGVLHSQRALAEVTEMIRTSNIIHKSILNLDDKTKEDVDLNFGNKITLLSGDYLLSKSYHQLACLKKQSLNELMSSALRDLVDGEFFGLHDEQNLPIPSRPLEKQTNFEVPDHFDTKPYKIDEVLGYTIAEWTLRSILSGGSLLAKSCQGALMLAEHPEKVQEMGYVFGKNVALAWQAKHDQEAFAPGNCAIFSLASAPVMFHLQSNPHIYDKVFVFKDDKYLVDYDDLRNSIKNGSALEKTRKLKEEHLNIALQVLKTLPVSDARMALENIICSVILES